MKTQVLRTSIMALLVAAAGYAQSSTPLRTDIPFSFDKSHFSTKNAGENAYSVMRQAANR